MDTSWLTVFRTIADTGSFTAAAERLGYTQSAISRQVAALESELGAVLFERRARGVRLTQEGRSLVAHAEAVLNRLAVARRDLSALQDLTAGRLRIGAFATAGVSLVPEAITAFRRDHPAIEVSHIDGLARELVAQVAGDDLDVAVVNGYPDQIAAFDTVRLQHLCDDPMMVVLPAGHRLANRRRPLRLSELENESWIAGSASPQETLISAALRQGFQPRIDFVVKEWGAKQGFVAAGLGVTLLPALAVASVRSDVAVVALHPQDALVRGVYVATSTGPTVAAVAAFHARLTEVAAALHARPSSLK